MKIYSRLKRASLINEHWAYDPSNENTGRCVYKRIIFTSFTLSVPSSFQKFAASVIESLSERGRERERWRLSLLNYRKRSNWQKSSKKIPGQDKLEKCVKHFLSDHCKNDDERAQGHLAQIIFNVSSEMFQLFSNDFPIGS